MSRIFSRAGGAPRAGTAPRPVGKMKKGKAMATFRRIKAALKTAFEDPSPDWNPARAAALWDETGPGRAKGGEKGREMPRAMVGPLLALLSSGGIVMWRAVLLLGRVSRALAAEGPEGEAYCRDLARRLMWRLNEDSGNLGWGCAEAFGEMLAMNPFLAASHGRVLLSYVRDTGHADNYLDYGPLRQGAYWAVGRMASAVPGYGGGAARLLVRGLDDAHVPCRPVAAWGLAALARSGRISRKDAGEALAGLASSAAGSGTCLVLDGETLVERDAAAFFGDAAEALGAVASVTNPRPPEA